MYQVHLQINLRLRMFERYTHQINHWPLKTGVVCFAYKRLELFLYEILFYENVQTEINKNFKNILRTYSDWESVKNVFIFLFCVCEKYKLIKEKEM